MQDTAAWHPAGELANGTRQNRNEVPVFPDYLKTYRKTKRAKGKSNEAPNTHDMWLSWELRESESCSSSSCIPLLLSFSTAYYISSTCSGKKHMSAAYYEWSVPGSATGSGAVAAAINANGCRMFCFVCFIPCTGGEKGYIGILHIL